MFFFLSFNKCWPTLFLAHFIILEVQLSESSFHILLYLFILLFKFNFIFHFTLKKMEKWNSWQKLYFWCKTKEFPLTKWILDLTLNSHYFLNISWGFFLLNSELQLPTAGLCTVILFFFFQCRAKLTLQYLSETFYFSVIFEWLPDYSWHLLIFFPLFPLSLDLIFFHHFLLESSAIHRFHNQLYFPGKSLLGIIC